jgi:hypothetical protein
MYTSRPEKGIKDIMAIEAEKRCSVNRNQYTGKKRQLELDRKKKQEEKLARKLARKNNPAIPEDGTGGVAEEGESAPSSAPPPDEPTNPEA